MSQSDQAIQQTIEEIERLTDSDSRRYGRLLNWQNSPDPFWHYGIGLSDRHIFDTGQGLRPFERADAKLVIGIDAISLPPEQVIQRLKYALSVFGDWQYTLMGWNCEHLGRLIATDQPRCYQSRPLWFLCDLTIAGDHKTARETFQKYLDAL